MADRMKNGRCAPAVIMKPLAGMDVALVALGVQRALAAT